MVKKKAVTGFILFLAGMWVCTLISKSVYTSRLPVVSTTSPESKYIEHRVEAEGIVIEGGKQAISSLSGLRVETVAVRIGDKIEEGDILFQVDLEDLKRLIGEKQDKISALQAEINALLENKALAQEKKEIEEARAREDYDTTSRLENTDVGRAQDRYVRAQQALDDFLSNPGSMDEESRRQQEQALRDAVQEAAYGEADAKRDWDQAIKAAERGVEDILFPEGSDSALSVSQMSLAALKEELEPFTRILNEGGIIKSDMAGTVTDIFVSVGGRVPDGAAVLLTDDTLPCQFKVFLDKEQKKYIGVGDSVSVKLDGGSSLETTVDYFMESQTIPGSFEVTIELPQNMGIPGLSGKIIYSKQGEKFECCISPEAVYRTDTRSYVYVLKSREGILGEEYFVEEVTVKVIDQNDTWVAIESSALDKESKIITSADQEIHKGDVVRWIE